MASGPATGLQEPSQANGSRDGQVLGGELPDIEDLLSCPEMPAAPVNRCLGNGRAQFQPAVAQPLSFPMGPLAQPVKLEQTIGDVKVEGALPENSEHPEADAQAKELQMVCTSFYTKTCEMMKYTRVKPPFPPEDESMAQPVQVEDGDSVLEFTKKKGVNVYSLAQKWPTSSTLAPVAKIRQTINGYLDETANPKWYEEFVLGTLHALHRRLTKHKDKIEGKVQFDIQVAYHQLDNRVSSLISLHKSVKAWLDAQVNKLLQETLEPFSVVIAYMMHTGRRMSEELNIVMLYATFQGMALNLESLADAIDKFDVSIFSLLSKMTELDPPEDQGAQPAEPTKEAVKGKPKTGKSASAADKAAAAAKKIGQALRARAVVGQTPVFHFAAMVSESMQTWLSDLPESIVKNEVQAYDLMVEIEVVLNNWRKKELIMRTESEDDTFSEVLHSVAVVARCVNVVESARPPTAQVRQARRVILDLVRQPSSPASELARTMQAYPVGKALMEASRLHVAQSIEDDTATSAFDQASKKFELNFAECFDGMVQWVQKMRDESQKSGYAVINNLFATLGVFFTSAHSAVTKWSAASAHSNLTFFGDNINNAMTILKVGKYMMVDIYAASLGKLVPDIGDAIVAVYHGVEMPGPAAGSAEGAEGGGTTDAAETIKQDPNEIIENFSTVAAQVESTLETFTHTLHSMSERWKKCVLQLHKRVGDAMDDHIPKEYVLNPCTFGSELQHTSGQLKDMIAIVKYCVALAQAKQRQPQTQDELEAFTDTIVKCAGALHSAHQAMFDFRGVESLATSMDIVREVSDQFKQFVETRGMRVYTDCADCFVDGKLAEISPGLSYTLGDVSEVVMKEVPFADAFGRLFVGCEPKDLLLDSVYWIDGEAEDDTAIGKLSYNKALSDLASFMEAGSLESIQIPNATRNGQVERMPVKSAKVYLDMIAQVKDVAGCAAKVHSDLKKLKPTDEEVFGAHVHAHRMMHRLLLRLDELLNSTELHDFEKAGWVCSINPPSLRQWLKGVAVFTGRAKLTMLQTMANILQTHVDSCKAVLPDINSAIDGNGNYVEKIAVKIFSDEPTVVAAYNRVHKTMSWLIRAARMMDVTPPVAEHDATAKARQVVSMIKGAEMLGELRLAPDGPQRARDYLAKYRNEKHQDVPVGFWREFESVAAESLEAGAAAACAKGGAAGSGSKSDEKSACQTPKAKAKVAQQEAKSTASKQKPQLDVKMEPQSEVGTSSGGTKRGASGPPQANSLKRAKRD
ncbi:unnamed protein product [Prorocentrum cordatum]|uniref:Exocyst complex component Sec6 n=1 Tax=Prorocentrum cordatum TaxID=2364126 RepID=A0ABN9UPY6_9DINO|nr:unnamed protein product [Polarella glacialis]